MRDDDTVDLNNRLEVIRKVAESEGAVLVEHFVCSRCRHPQQTIHLWLETLRCCRCGQMNPSAVPRRPTPGEVTAEHLAQAVQTYRAAYKMLLDGRAISDLEVEGARTISGEDHSAVKFALETLDRVARLAGEMARKEAADG